MDRDYIAFSIIGFMVLLTITAAGLAISYLQKLNDDKHRESHKSLGIAALTFQVALSILILITLGMLFVPIISSGKGYKTKKLQTHSGFGFSMSVGMLSIIAMMCAIVGNILFYVSYFDKTQSDKQLDDVAVGFQYTVPLYVASLFGIASAGYVMS